MGYMRRLSIFSKKNIGILLAIFIVVASLVLGIIKVYPFVNHINDLNTGDDWYSYARYARDILRNGILMPSEAAPYEQPAGFLYSYFLALCFFIFGENDFPVYIVQHLMMGLAIVIMYLAFRDKMRRFTSLLFLGTLFIFALLDIHKWYAAIFLSENLAYFIVPLFFLCFIRGFEKNAPKLQMASAFLLGICVLTRPNIILFGFILIFILGRYYFKKRREKWFAYLLVFVAIMTATISLLAVRNYLLCGKAYFLPTRNKPSISATLHYGNPIPKSIDLSKVNTNILYAKLNMDKPLAQYIEYLRQKPSLFFGYFFKKILYCFGFLSFLDHAHQWRPHWILMWIAYFIYLFLRKLENKKMEMWEVTVHLYIVCYYFTAIITTPINNYGYRVLTPVVNFVLLFSFLALDRLLDLKSLLRIKGSVTKES